MIEKDILWVISNSLSGIGIKHVPGLFRKERKSGVSDGIRTRANWGHNPVLCQLSYTHHPFRTMYHAFHILQ